MENNSAPPSQAGPSGAPATGANPMYSSPLAQALAMEEARQKAPALQAMRAKLAEQDAARHAEYAKMNPVPKPGPAYDPAHAVVSGDEPVPPPPGTVAPTGNPNGDIGVKPTNSPIGDYLAPQESSLRQKQQANISNYIQSGGK